MTEPPSAVEYQCCFCAKEILRDGADPILLTIVLERDAEQDLYCHRECLRNALHPSVPLYTWDADA
jgi:hypothetical protein